jgi:hypothetical protein
MIYINRKDDFGNLETVDEFNQCLATMQDKFKRLEQQGHKLKLIRGK